MEKYVSINPEQLKNATKQVEGMTVALSPYDIPKAIVANYLRDPGQFVIGFQYIDDEKPVVSNVQYGITAFHGKYSGKLLRLSIPINEPPHEPASIIQLRTQVLDAISRAPNYSSHTGGMNRRITRELLEEQFAELVAGIPQTLVSK